MSDGTNVFEEQSDIHAVQEQTAHREIRYKMSDIRVLNSEGKREYGPANRRELEVRNVYKLALLPEFCRARLLPEQRGNGLGYVRELAAEEWSVYDRGPALARGKPLVAVRPPTLLQLISPRFWSLGLHTIRGGSDATRSENYGRSLSLHFSPEPVYPHQPPPLELDFSPRCSLHDRSVCPTARVHLR